jgi:hypothetical protein
VHKVTLDRVVCGDEIQVTDSIQKDTTRATDYIVPRKTRYYRGTRCSGLMIQGRYSKRHTTQRTFDTQEKLGVTVLVQRRTIISGNYKSIIYRNVPTKLRSNTPNAVITRS